MLVWQVQPQAAGPQDLQSPGGSRLRRRTFVVKEINGAMKIFDANTGEEVHRLGDAVMTEVMKQAGPSMGGNQGLMQMQMQQQRRPQLAYGGYGEEAGGDPDLDVRSMELAARSTPSAKAHRRANRSTLNHSVASARTSPANRSGITRPPTVVPLGGGLGSGRTAAPLPPPPRTQRVRSPPALQEAGSDGVAGDFPWWQTGLPGREALRLIDGQGDGAFVLRANRADLILSFVFQGRIYDDLVLPSQHPSGVYLERVSHKLFRNVEEMVGYYMDPRPEMPCPLRILLNQPRQYITAGSGATAGRGPRPQLQAPRHPARADAPGEEQLTLDAQRLMSRRINQGHERPRADAGQSSGVEGATTADDMSVGSSQAGFAPASMQRPTPAPSPTTRRLTAQERNEAGLRTRPLPERDAGGQQRPAAPSPTAEKGRTKSKSWRSKSFGRGKRGKGKNKGAESAGNTTQASDSEAASSTSGKPPKAKRSWRDRMRLRSSRRGRQPTDG